MEIKIKGKMKNNNCENNDVDRSLMLVISS